MEIIREGFTQAAGLLINLDPEIVRIILLSLFVSCTATIVSVTLGVSAGVMLTQTRFPGKILVLAAVNTGMGLPPVVVGLFVTLMLWRSGPFGEMGILYTPAAMMIAQCIIATPIVTGLTVASLQSLPTGLKPRILSLGAGRMQLAWTLVREARLPIYAAVIAGFGGVISEVGASIMVGGNIKGQTRVLTTATVMETSMGHFDVAVALGLILMLITFFVTYTLTRMQQQRRREP